ncbi:membrane protein [Streptomyces narbonensis]|uniref:YoaK family protein n=1 Tax=Streptomyces narbonensis TaxID=67333 RepID=UPI001673DDC6|nr:YoaK family protein [Streptomyces narbonensis]GGV99145.1 membrane protein [Streptomyces narbonensis]
MSVSAPADPRPKVLVALTAVTGIVDAVAFLGLGQIFTAFMTGNILFLGFALAGGEGLAPLASFTALAAFAVGAVASSRLGVAWGGRPRRWIFTSAVVAAALLVTGALAALGLPSVVGEPSPRHYAVIASTALAMGVRSATMWRLGGVLNTTLVTGTLVTWIRYSALGSGPGDPYQLYRLAGLAAVLTGAAIGTVLLQVSITVALLVAAAGVLGGMGGYAARLTPSA